MDQKLLSAEAVIWGYRYLLGRDPENEIVVEQHRSVGSWRNLRNVFVNSTEYQSRIGEHKWPDRWVIADLGDRKMWVNISDRLVSFPCLQGDYEPHETRLVKALLSPGDVFVDIGANIGWFSALATTILRESGSIYAFEPRPDTYERLVATLALSDMPDRAFSFQVGLAEEAGTMNLTWGENTPNPGGSRLIHGDVEQGQEGIKVELRTLDSVSLPACDLIKIDVEGAEMIALRGGLRTITKGRPIILSEVHDAQLRSVSRCSAIEYVREICGLGYECLRVETGEVTAPTASSEGEVMNVVFVPVERVSEVKRRLW